MRDFHWMGLRLYPFLIITVVISGCVAGRPSIREPAVPPRVATPPSASVSVIPLDRVEARIKRLEGLLAEKGALIEGQQKAARRLLDGYYGLLTELRNPEVDGRSQRASAMLFDQIEALEETYFEKGRSREERDTSMLSRLAREWSRIQTAYLSGDYSRVVRACEDLKDLYGPDAVNPELGVLLAMALAEKGEIRKATAVAEQTLVRLEGQPDPFHLRSRLVAWYVALGERKHAADQWDRLTDLVREQEGLFESTRQALLQDVDRRPGSATPVEHGQQAPEATSLNDLLERVDRLIQSQAFERAKFMLIRQRIRYPEGPDTQAIDQAMERVERAERERSLETVAPQALDPSLDDASLEEVRRLMETEDYEGALKKLDDLAGISGPDTAEVEDLRESATSQFIRVERNKAAQMFLKAKSAADPGKKEDLLRSSYTLLRGLLDRFPDSTLARQLESNLETVILEMEKAGLSPEKWKRRE